MNGKAVLPMAIAAELMCQAAISTNPGLKFVGYDEMRIQKGIVLESDSLTLGVYTAIPQIIEKGLYKVPVEIRTDGAKWQHVNAKADIMLADNDYAVKSPEPQPVDTGNSYAHTVEEAYKNYLFHGEFLQALTSIKGWSAEGIAATSKTSLPVEKWFENSKFSNWQSDPLMIDAAYQLMILWTTEVFGAPSLPNFAKSYRQFVKDLDSQQVTISAKASKKGTSAATAEIEFITCDGKVAAKIEGYECTINAALSNAFKNNSLGV